MELVRWSPASNFFCRSNDWSRMFDGFFHAADRRRRGRSGRAWLPSVDILENDDNFVVKAELPGMDKKDIEIDVKGRVLTLQGERTSESEVKEGAWHRKERTCGKFKRSFTLPTDVDADAIKAVYKNGVLNIDIPKPEERKPRQIAVR